MSKAKLFEKFKYILIFAIASLLMEMVTFLSLNMGVVPTYILFDLVYIFTISSILFLLDSRKIKLTIIIVLFILQLVLNCVNICYYNILGDIFSFDLLVLGGEAAKAFDLSYIDFRIIFNIAIFAFSIAILCTSTKKYKKTIKIENNNTKIKNAKLINATKSHSLALFLAFVFLFNFFGVGSQVVAVSSLTDYPTTDEYYIAKSDSYLYNHFQFKQEAFKKFGTFGFYLKSLQDIIVDDGLSEEELKKLQDYVDEGIVGANENALLYGNNLIMVMLESFEWFAIDPICTPTLYELKTNSAQTFTNFRARNKTNMSENIGFLGSTVKNYMFENLAQDKNCKPANSLAYIFRDLGYSANFFHTYDGDFYKRYDVNTQLGFEKVYALNESSLDKDITLGYQELEEKFIKEMIDKIAPTDKQFFSFYTTCGTHGTYKTLNHRYENYFKIYDENFSSIKDYLESEGYVVPTDEENYNILKEYKCAAMDTDRMVKYLLDYLTKNGLIENTTIVFYSDHNAYLNQLATTMRYGDDLVDPNQSDQYNIPFMIYDNTLKGKQIDTFCNTYDIYPTICNLFGLSYNKNLIQGYDVYSEDIKNSIFVSNLTGMFTDKLYSYNINDVIDFGEEKAGETKVSLFKKNAINFIEKQEKIDKIYRHFLYKHA